ncbi:MAG: phenylalanine--tRNA ligase subunit beta [Longimicrobiales bacterium]
MNVSYRWLKALAPELTLSPQDMAELLALRGAPVEELTPLASDLEGLTVARVDTVDAHPDADLLSVCRVEAGAGPVQVVCGAPNVEVGRFYPFAPVGSTLPGGTEIGRARIRGVESQGMLCSEAELELGPDASGLMALEGDFVPGSSLSEALGMNDWRLDVEITANRGDLLSHAGVVRELSPRGTGGPSLPPIPGSSPLELPLSTDPEEVVENGITIRIRDPELCSRYLGAVIRGVKVGPSPAWLAQRIRAAGSRPINNVVDATNYVLLELGQPLHAFDLARLKDSTIEVRRAREGESIRTLDEEDRRLKEDMLAICDAVDPVAIAGVMGGEDSEVSEETTDVLLECALFEPGSIRSTRTALGMSTDASYRFERGVDPQQMELAVRRAVEIILATAGGKADGRVLDVCPRPWKGLTVPLRPSRVPVLLGISLTSKEIEEMLSPLGFQVVGSGRDRLDVAVPGFRSYDVLREVDLLEEVARTYGYDRFPDDLKPFRPGTVPDHPLFRLEDELRDLMVGRGFLEAQNQAFAPEGEGEVALTNPISAQEGFLRTALLPGLLRRVEHNFARGRRDVRLFELGTVFFSLDTGELPREETHLGLVMTGSSQPLHWSGSAAETDLWDLKGLLSTLIPGCRLFGGTLRQGAPEKGDLVSGEGFTVLDAEGETLGHGGRIRDGVVDAPAWAGPVWAAELTLPAVPEERPVPVFEPLPTFPGVDRDLALLLSNSLPAGQVEEVIREAGGPYLAEVQVFDLYQGKGVPEGYRSVAFRLRFQSRERTLTDEDVERAVGSVTDRLREELGVERRG